MTIGGRSFLSRVVSSLARGGCDPVVVVTSGDESVSEAALAAGARVLVNPEPGEGPITSLRLALAAIEPEIDAIAYLPTDHPLVTEDTVALLLEAARRSEAPLTLPVVGEKRGHPAVFRRSLFGALLDPSLEGGARTVVHRELPRAELVRVEDRGSILDIDTPERYPEALREMRIGPVEAARILLTTAESGGTAAAASVIGAPSEGMLGARLVLTRREGHSETRGSLGEPELDEAAVDLMARAVDDPKVRDGSHTVGTPLGPVELYVETRRPLRELIVVGAGHIAQPMAHLGALLGFRVTVLDDRPDFATRERFPDAHRLVRADFGDPFAEVDLHERSHLLLVTRGHKYDYECLLRALRAEPLPAYIGMIGSRRRVRATYLQLLEEGVDRALLDLVHAPVGLDIGAETPEEIAVAVAAELVKLDRGGSGLALRDVERVADRFFETSTTGGTER
jgi:xanthine dehydrogenase accessory factor